MTVAGGGGGGGDGAKTLHDRTLLNCGGMNNLEYDGETPDSFLCVFAFFELHLAFVLFRLRPSRSDMSSLGQYNRDWIEESLFNGGERIITLPHINDIQS